MAFVFVGSASPAGSLFSVPGMYEMNFMISHIMLQCVAV